MNTYRRSISYFKHGLPNLTLENHRLALLLVLLSHAFLACTGYVDLHEVGLDGVDDAIGDYKMSTVIRILYLLIKKLPIREATAHTRVIWQIVLDAFVLHCFFVELLSRELFVSGNVAYRLDLALFEDLQKIYLSFTTEIMEKQLPFLFLS